MKIVHDLKFTNINNLLRTQEVAAHITKSQNYFF